MLHSDGQDYRKEVIEMRMMKHCPKCGSAHVSPLVFYRPSIWKCLDCGYEGAFIIEGGTFAEIMQERYRKRHGILGWVGGEPRMNNCGGPADDWQRTLEDRMKSFAATIEDSAHAGLRL